MPDPVQQDCLAISEDLVHHAIVSDSQFEQSSQVSRERLRANGVDILGQPTDSFNDAASDDSVERPQII